MIGRRRLPLLFAVLAAAFLVAPAGACPFCGMQGETLTQSVSQAALVIYGTLQNARLTNTGDLENGETDLEIETVIKPHDIIAGKKKIVISKYVPTDKKEKVKYLIFCDVFNGKIDPYRGMPVKLGGDMPTYLVGASEVKDKKVAERLKFFFKYLQNEDLEIANDALKEFGNADYKDYHQMAGSLPPDTVHGWLEDKKTPAYRIGLYASMLGHCSKDKDRDAKLLRSLIEDPDKRVSSGIDGVLAGYVLIKPKEGWNYLLGVLRNPKNEFMLRYAALRAARFFVDFRPEVMPKQQVVDGVSQLLEQSDIADLAVEDLRKWKCWDYTSKVLTLRQRESHDIPIVKRSILRFALSSTDTAAKDYVEKEKKADEQAVNEALELLKLEQESTPMAPAPKDTK